MYYSIKKINLKNVFIKKKLKTFTRLGLIRSTRQAATPCRSAGDLYQALAGSDEQVLTGNRATCSQALIFIYLFQILQQQNEHATNET